VSHVIVNISTIVQALKTPEELNGELKDELDSYFLLHEIAIQVLMILFHYIISYFGLVGSSMTNQ
jgi:hypothetical protein